MPTKKKMRPEAKAKAAADAPPVPVVRGPRYPDRKISETILDFGAPLFGTLPPEPPIEVFRNLLSVIIAVWNVGTMAFPIWGCQNKTAAEWDNLHRQAPPDYWVVFEQLARRRSTPPFNTDQRAVGEWSVKPDGKGGFIVRCDAHLPDEPSDSKASG